MGGICNKGAGKGFQIINQMANQAQGNYEQNLEYLNQYQYLVLNQRIDWYQVIKCCEKSIVFDMFKTSGPEHLLPLGHIGIKQEMMYIESSSCCCRQFCRAAREFKGTLSMNGMDLATMDAPYKCHTAIPCCSCPCTEPETYITTPDGRQMFGYLKQPYSVCWCKSVEACPLIEIEIYNAENGTLVSPPVFKLVGNCCQKATICLPFGCLGCPIIEYNIIPGDVQGINPQVGSVGKIKNICRDCPEEFFTRADRFGIDFPPKATGKQRLLIIMAAIWLDMLQYEFL